MITVRDVDVRVGARLLLSGVSLHVSPGDRVGLVGRNGAGKTTLLHTLAGTLRPAAGTVARTGDVGHLPQDSRAADQSVTVTDRILSARGLDRAVRALRRAEAAMADGAERSMNAYVRAETEFQARGGYAAEAEAARVAAGVGCRMALMDRPLGALSGGQQPARGTGPHPVRRARHPAAGRADEPPGRALDHLAARLPREPSGRAGDDQP